MTSEKAEEYLERIALTLESICNHGVQVYIEFPDLNDKFCTDLPAMKIVEAIDNLTTAISSLEIKKE